MPVKKYKDYTHHFKIVALLVLSLQGDGSVKSFPIYPPRSNLMVGLPMTLVASNTVFGIQKKTFSKDESHTYQRAGTNHINRWVMYVHDKKLDKLNEGTYEVLGQDKEGSWFSISTIDLSSVFVADPQAAVLYYSEESYQHALRKLSEQEIAVVIKHRLRHWSLNTLNEMLNWLYDLQRQVLMLTTCAMRQADPRIRPRLEAHFKEGLNWLLVVSGEAAANETELLELLDDLTDWEARLLEELALVADLEAKSGELGLVAKAKQLANKVKARGVQIGNVLVQKGYWEGDPAMLPYIEVSRGVYIEPADKTLIDSFKARHLPVKVWNKGVVTVFSPRKLKSKFTVTVLYLDSGQFTLDVNKLTKAQMDHELSERFKNSPDASLEAVVAHIGGVLIQVALKRRKALIKAMNKAPELEKLLGQQVNIEIQDLADWWASESSELVTANQASLQLQETEKTLLANLKAMIDLAQRQTWKDLALILQEALKQKQAAYQKLIKN